MRSAVLPFLSVICLIFVSACATQGVPTDVHYDPHKSQALNVAEMAGLDGLRDVPYQDWNQNNPIGDGLDATYAISNIFSPAPGFGLGGGLAFSALFLLTAGEPPHPATYNHIWLWLPEDKVPSAEQGNEYAMDLVYQAVLSTFDPDKSLMEKTRIFKPTFAGNSEHKTLVEPDCPEVHDTHNDSYNLSCSGDLQPKISYYYEDALEYVAPAPVFTKIAGNAYGPVEVSFSATGIFLDQIWKLNDRNFWIEVSKKLPSSAFIYVAPVRSKSLPPVILNRGQVMLFVGPKNSETAPG
ncbi:hypothetical protein LPB41_02615 [Thalassospira sp. MA62]|nr:hypothetical protein [Thalassospira sp. MA62]